MHPHELPLPLLIRLQARSGAVPAAGKGVIAGQGFEPVDLPVRGIVAVPAALSDPLMMPVLGSSVSPAGRFVAEKLSGPSPVAGIRNTSGRPGVHPVIRGP